MKKIYFDETTFIWKGKLNVPSYKDELLEEAYTVIESQPDTKTDGFGYKKEWNDNLNFIGKIDIKTKMDEIIQNGINECKKIYDEKNKQYNKVNIDSWVNVVRSVNPVQHQFKHNEIKGIDKYHNHVEINKIMKSFTPDYTYVYYVQMPDVMEDDDGVLFFRGQNKQEYWIRPEEDDLIIMEGWMPHAPNNAPKSTIDRIVIAGNVGFEMIKKANSLI